MSVCNCCVLVNMNTSPMEEQLHTSGELELASELQLSLRASDKLPLLQRGRCCRLITSDCLPGRIYRNSDGTSEVRHPGNYMNSAQSNQLVSAGQTELFLSVTPPAGGHSGVTRENKQFGFTLSSGEMNF